MQINSNGTDSVASLRRKLFSNYSELEQNKCRTNLCIFPVPSSHGLPFHIHGPSLSGDEDFRELFTFKERVWNFAFFPQFMNSNQLTRTTEESCEIKKTMQVVKTRKKQKIVNTVSQAQPCPQPHWGMAEGQTIASLRKLWIGLALGSFRGHFQGQFWSKSVINRD